jgi:hypothetical protein
MPQTQGRDENYKIGSKYIPGEEKMKRIAFVVLVLFAAFATAPDISLAAVRGGKAKVVMVNSNSAIALRMAMRKLWEDHITYTSFYITSALAGSDDAGKVAERLLKNQEDLGNAIKPVYGEAAGNKLTALLKDHILIAVDLVKAAKEGNKEATAAADKKWHKNGEEIAEFLSAANPKNWPKKALTDMMFAHLAVTKDAVVAKLKKDHAAAIVAYDKGHDHILMMADALANGIVKQFPEKFRK